MDKTIRERAENNERKILSEKACLSCNSLGREVREEECSIRTCFQRDRDRIIHSSSFRTLKHKTQVFLAPSGDYYRTRLTHTLEVSQIARTLARALRLNEDLTEAIALGHDLGHTPFGHAGERALNSVSGIDFKHYEQSVRVVTKIEKDGAGLNLTKEVIDGIGCHTSGKKAFTFEGQIIRLADRIAYINHDIDDAVAAGVMNEDEIPAHITAVLGNRKSERINKLVFDAVENSTDEICLGSETSQAFDELTDFMFRRVYSSDICRKEDDKACDIIEKMFFFYKNNPQLMPKIFIDISNSEGVPRAVCDYIAGMSDTVALKKFNELFLPKFALE